VKCCWRSTTTKKLYGEIKREMQYLSVSLGTIRIISFGLKLRALLMNWFAREALNPKGGFSPMICR
jgi:hypothetical protein